MSFNSTTTTWYGDEHDHEEGTDEAPIEGCACQQGTLLETTRDPWPIAATILSFACFIVLLVK